MAGSINKRKLTAGTLAAVLGAASPAGADTAVLTVSKIHVSGGVAALVVTVPDQEACLEVGRGATAGDVYVGLTCLGTSGKAEPFLCKAVSENQAVCNRISGPR